MKESLEKQILWLEKSELEMNSILSDMVAQRYVKELAAVNHLIDSIEDSINDAQPVPELWLISPDAVAVNPKNVWSDYEEHLPVHLRLQPPPAPAQEEEVEAERPTSGSLTKSAGLSARGKGLLGKVKQASNHGFVPERSDHADEINRASKTSSSTVKIERQPNSNTKATNHLSLRKPTAAAVPHGPSGGDAVDEQYLKDMAIFHAHRLKFEDKLMKKRAEREKEFRSLGMSASTAKLAAYNELLLEEQQDMLDFDARNKPKRRPNSHSSQRKHLQHHPSVAVGLSSHSKRAPAGDHHERPTSAKAAVH